MTLDRKAGSATPPSAVDRWNRVLREAGLGEEVARAEAQAVAELSDEEVDRQLLAAGVDLDAEAVKADATYEAAVAKLVDRLAASHAEDDGHGQSVAWVAPVRSLPRSPQRSARSRRVVWLAYAVAAAAATGGAAYVAGHQKHEEPKKEEPVVVPPEPAPAPPPPTASAAPLPPPPPPATETEPTKAPRRSPPKRP